MTETANILHNATENSLVLLDEIGRGTSTFDGLALAWAIARQLIAKTQCHTLFATHYFELTQLAQEFRQVANVHLDAVEHRDHIVFLHSVEEGPASQSYGLQVAQLAGVPAAVIQQAKKRLLQLEQQGMDGKPARRSVRRGADCSDGRRTPRAGNAETAARRTNSARKRRWN